MIVSEILEGVVPIAGRKGSRNVRKYRCTSGSRKGRIVAKPSTCTAPKRMSSSISLKKAKSKRGSQIKVSSARTKRANQAHKRLSKLNVHARSKIKPQRKSSKRKKI